MGDIPSSERSQALLDAIPRYTIPPDLATSGLPVLNGICDKLISRHPHIYGDITVKDEAEVKRNWEQLKLKEGNKSVLEGVPISLPALVKALRMQEKTKQVGFEWETTEQVWAKVEEECPTTMFAVNELSETAICPEQFTPAPRPNPYNGIGTLPCCMFRNRLL